MPSPPRSFANALRYIEPPPLVTRAWFSCAFVSSSVPFSHLICLSLICPFLSLISCPLFSSHLPFSHLPFSAEPSLCALFCTSFGSFSCLSICFSVVLLFCNRPCVVIGCALAYAAASTQALPNGKRLPLVTFSRVFRDKTVALQNTLKCDMSSPRSTFVVGKIFIFPEKMGIFGFTLITRKMKSGDVRKVEMRREIFLCRTG